MNATSFHTLEVARGLEVPGVPSEQTEAHAAALRKAATADRDDLVTKGDLYRALWIQGAGIVTIIGGFIAIASALELL